MITDGPTNVNVDHHPAAPTFSATQVDEISMY